MMSNARWLEPFSWEFVVAQNEVLCRQKSAHHGPTSDGHSDAKIFWEDVARQEMSLFDAIEVCRKCHKMVPFTNFNGNTFAAIARVLVNRLNLDFKQEYLARSLAGHIVAGVASEEEIRAFKEFSASLG
jgi:transcriptional antiterminator Rof (Rho-off)